MPPAQGRASKSAGEKEAEKGGAEAKVVKLELKPN